MILLSRKGLSEHLSVGTGPVTAVFQQPGVFSGDVFCVSGGVLHRNSRALGTVNGGGRVSIAGRDGELLVTAGQALYSYNGTDFQPVAFPDGAPVTAVEYHDGLFIAARGDSHKYYWSAVLNGRSWGALDFASAHPERVSRLALVSTSRPPATSRSV